jgi:hypothetical protein
MRPRTAKRSKGFPVVPKADRRLSMLGEDRGEVNRIFVRLTVADTF